MVLCSVGVLSSSSHVLAVLNVLPTGANHGAGICVFFRVDMDSTIPAREGPGGDINRSGPRGSEAR